MVCEGKKKGFVYFSSGGEFIKFQVPVPFTVGCQCEESSPPDEPDEPPPDEPPKPPPKPKPRTGVMCKSGDQVIVLLPEGSTGVYKIYSDFDEESDEQSPDESGWMSFSGMRFDSETTSPYTGDIGEIQLHVFNEEWGDWEPINNPIYYTIVSALDNCYTPPPDDDDNDDDNDDGDDDGNPPPPPPKWRTCKLKVLHGGQTIAEFIVDECNYLTSCDDDCPEGYHKCKVGKYPGYCCVDCQQLKNRFWEMNNRIDEILGGIGLW